MGRELTPERRFDVEDHEDLLLFLTLTLAAIGTAGALAMVGSAAASGPRPGPGEPTLSEVRRLTERFRDMNVALAEGYIRDPGNLCDTATKRGFAAVCAQPAHGWDNPVASLRLPAMPGSP
jgi:hypothetical protein